MFMTDIDPERYLFEVEEYLQAKRERNLGASDGGISLFLSMDVSTTIRG